MEMRSISFQENDSLNLIKKYKRWNEDDKRNLFQRTIET